jgi:exosome complex exonuclease DIS3/RRP44
MVEIKILKRPRSEAVITQRKFFKKTAKGKVIKGVLEPPLASSVLISDA